MSASRSDDHNRLQLDQAMEGSELGQDRDRHSEQQQYSQHPSDPSNEVKERSETQNCVPVDNDSANHSDKVSPHDF